MINHKSTSLSHYLFITTILLVALFLSILPLPSWAVMCRPIWVALVVIYCGTNLPGYTGLGVAWCCGLLLDVMYGSPLGEHALAMTMIAYFSQKIYRQMRYQPFIEQSLWVFMVLMSYQCLLFFIQMITAQPMSLGLLFIPPLISMMIWPLVKFILNSASHRV